MSRAETDKREFNKMTPEEIRIVLRDRRLQVVADETGLHYNTVRAVRDGTVARPAWDTIQKLGAYLKGKSA